MSRDLVCNECGGEMQRGYVPNFLFNQENQTFWVEGKAEKTFFGLLKIRDRKNYDIVAYRCKDCGAIKFYAGPDHSSEKKSE